jgi:DNA polymerase-3 subunit delta'
MKLNSILPWQQRQWQTVIARHAQNQLPHALLLTGSAGLGKLHFAKCLAQLLLCGNGTTAACGNCHACHLLQADTHPDLILIQPEETGKAIKVEQIRQLINSVAQTAQQGKCRVVIIEPAHAMNIAAANALLKTLEEPFGKVILILVTHHPALLPATVRSRCQNIIFSAMAIDREQQETWLQQQLPNAVVAKQLLQLTEWAPLKALELHEKNYWQQEEKFLQDFERVITNSLDPIKFAASWAAQGVQFSLEIITRVLNDALCLKMAISENLLLYKDKSHLLIILQNRLSKDKLLQLLQQAVEANQLITRNANLNQQLMLESFMLAVIPSETRDLQ